jgi:hypothetical protein
VDGICDSANQASIRGLQHRPSRRGAVGSVALPYVLGTGQLFRSSPVWRTPREALLLAAGLQDPDGVGLRPDRELAGGDVDARKSHSHAVNFHACAALGDDPHNLNPGVGRRVVDRGCLDRRGRPMATVAATP